MKSDNRKNLIRIEEIVLTLNEDESVLEGRIAKILEISKNEIIRYFVVRRAVDSRKKGNILFVYSVDVEINNLKKYFLPKTQSLPSIKKKRVRHKIREQEGYDYKIKKVLSSDLPRPIVVGTGPSGLFCALVLAAAGLKPIVVERGLDVDARVKDVNNFFSKGELNVNSNIQFGEGGAGTFSDGKLHTNVKDPRTKYIFDKLIAAGAPKRIASDAQPHIGTDKLREVVKNIRKKIIKLNGEVKFETCLTSVETEKGRVVAAVFNGRDKVLVDDLVLAVGHSARDTYQMLYDKKLRMSAKPFAIGLRIEHPAALINKSQYGDYYNHAKLPTARYKLVAHNKKSRSVYTFCMCPGGVVVAAASEAGMVVVNGMSVYAQNGDNSNSALLVNVTPADFDSSHPLAGIKFQRKWERAAFAAGGNDYRAPAQLVGDFLKGKSSERIGSVIPSYKPDVVLTSLEDCLPAYVIKSIKEALPVLDRKIKGFAHEDAVLTGVETRSSAPVRFVRNESFQSTVSGIYPAGEGSGYAGGIVSSAIDGIKVAESIIEKYSSTLAA